MKKAVLFLSVVLILVQALPAYAQVVDMRAYSRRHGFKAYQNKQVSRPAATQREKRTTEQKSFTQVRPLAENKIQEKSEAASPLKQKTAEQQNVKKPEETVDQSDEMRRYIENNPQVIPDI